MPKQSKNGQPKGTSTVHVAVSKSTLRKVRQFVDPKNLSVNWCLGQIIDRCVNEWGLDRVLEGYGDGGRYTITRVTEAP